MKTPHSTQTWQIYLLRCADGSLYTGCTNNLARRIQQHQAGTAAKYTRSRLPVKLVYSEPCQDRSTAQAKEAAIKALTKNEKEALVASNPAYTYLMISETFTFFGQVEKYPGPDGWFYVAVPDKIAAKLKPFADRGLVAVTAAVGSSTWKTSLLPKGDGSVFLPLKQSVRSAEQIQLGDHITATIQLRER